MTYLRYFLLALVIIALDQASKLVVYENMFRGEELVVLGEWFKIHYTVNPGVAFGISADTPWGKMALVIFRIIAVFGLGYYLVKEIGKKQIKSYLIALTMITAGALGNVIDSLFYGVFLKNNAVRYPGFLPDEIPFYPWFQGQVIDMFYFDLAKGIFPYEWPFIGGKSYSFWPIFNVADASIFLGVVTVLILHKKVLEEADKEKTDTTEVDLDNNPATASS